MEKDNRSKYKKRAECSEFIQELLDIGNLSQSKAREVPKYGFIFYLLTEITTLSERFRADKHHHTEESFYLVPIRPTVVWYEYEKTETGFNRKPTIRPAETVQLVVASDGLMNFELTSPIETLRGQDIERIRRCFVCQNFFWAKKSNADTCNKKCAKTLYNHKRTKTEKAAKAEAKAARARWKNQDFSKKEK